MKLRYVMLAVMVTGALAWAQSGSPPDAPTPQTQQQAPSTSTQTAPAAQPQTTDPNDPNSPDYKGDKPKKGSILQHMKDAVTAPPCIRVGGGGCMNQTPQTKVPDTGSHPDSGDSEQQTSQPSDKRPGAVPPNQQMPRSDQNRSLSDDGESSSRSTIIDLSPPRNDAANHPNSAVEDDVTEVRKWDPHKSIKAVEVGDYYLQLGKQAGDGSNLQRDRFRAAESRYLEALEYKDNNAEAMYKLAFAAERLNKPEEARKYYALYLKTLPHGDHADESQKALARLGAAPTAEKQ